LAPPASGTTVYWAAGILQSDAGTIQSPAGATTLNTVLTEGSYNVP
jgi:hypothetical protein